MGVGIAYVEINTEAKANQYQLMAKYCNIWRNYYDIQDDWSSISSIIDYWGTANGNDYDAFVNVARPGSCIYVASCLSIYPSRCTCVIWVGSF